jgi:hypothetical protein
MEEWEVQELVETREKSEKERRRPKPAGGDWKTEKERSKVES